MDSKYWADAKPEEIGQHLQGRVERFDTGWGSSGLRSILEQANRTYFGSAYSSSWGAGSSVFVQRTGDEGEAIEFEIPLAKSLATSMLQIITGGPKTQFICSPTNSDAQSIAGAALGNHILSQYWTLQKLEQKCVQAVEMSIVSAEHFVLPLWNEDTGPEQAAPGGKVIHQGDLEYLTIPSCDVIRDPSAKSFEQLNWVIVRRFVNRYDLAASHPDKAPEILAVSDATTNDTSMTLIGETELIPLYTFYHRKTRARPFGRETLFVNAATVLRDTNLKTREIPLCRMFMGELDGTPWAVSPWWGLLATEDMCNSLVGSLATNITTIAGGLVSAIAGSELPLDSIGGDGLKVIYRQDGTEPPTAINLNPNSGDQFKFVDYLRNAQRLTVGVTDISMGVAPSAQPNAQAYALLYSASAANQNRPQSNYTEFLRRVGRISLELLQANLTTERKLQLAGKGSSALIHLAPYSGKDLQAISDVTVDLGTYLTQTPAGRQQKADTYLKAGWITTPADYDMMLETGRMEANTVDLLAERALIASENAQLMDGKLPSVLVSDNHLLHGHSHADLGKDPEARKNPKVMGAITEHLRQHKLTWMEADPLDLLLVGQQPPPQPPPQVGAGMGPGGPPGGDPQAGLPQDPPVDGLPPESAVLGDTQLPSLPADPLTGQPPDIQ